MYSILKIPHFNSEIKVNDRINSNIHSNLYYDNDNTSTKIDYNENDYFLITVQINCVIYIQFYLLICCKILLIM